MQLTHPPKSTHTSVLSPGAGPSNASDSQEPLGGLRGAPHIHSLASCPSLLSVPGSLLPPSDYKLLTLGGGPAIPFPQHPHFSVPRLRPCFVRPSPFPAPAPQYLMPCQSPLV